MPQIQANSTSYVVLDNNFICPQIWKHYHAEPKQFSRSHNDALIHLHFYKGKESAVLHRISGEFNQYRDGKLHISVSKLKKRCGGQRIMYVRLLVFSTVSVTFGDIKTLTSYSNYR